MNDKDFIDIWHELQFKKRHKKQNNKCIKLGRHYIGCEIEKGYYDIAVKRIKSI